MKIKLVRTGGFIPVTKVAETEVDFSESEIDRLIQIIQPDYNSPKIKDGQYYELTVGFRSTQVDLEKVPEEYKELFSRLKSDLRIVR